MTGEALLRLVEFVLWVAVVATIVVALGGVAGYAIGGGLLGVKYALFVVGSVLFGVGSLAIQPAGPHEDDRWVSLESDHQTRLEASIQRVPPLEDGALPFDRRVGRGVKLFATSMVVLGVSAWLEFGLGVQV